MNWIADFVGSSIGKKVLMAASGVALFGFLLAHLSGNLIVYRGPEAFNAYAEFLQHNPLLWPARLGLLALVGVHIWASTSLTLANKAARPVAYREVERAASTYASRTMWWSGPLLALFIVYHLLHMTVGSAHPQFIRGDAYHNFVTGFAVPWSSGFYIVAMLCLGLHLRHGVWSMLQSVGLSHPRYDAIRERVATAFAAFVVVVNISFPVAVLAGIVK
jgi:succinate dehydrogenase / fumarate reductase cytochrome b subunit